LITAYYKGRYAYLYGSGVLGGRQSQLDAGQRLETREGRGLKFRVEPGGGRREWVLDVSGEREQEGVLR
jgi:hypothetical protein